MSLSTEEEQELLYCPYFFDFSNPKIRIKMANFALIKEFNISLLDDFIVATKQSFFVIVEIKDNTIEVKNYRKEHFSISVHKKKRCFQKEEAMIEKEVTCIYLLYKGVCRYYEYDEEKETFELFKISIKKSNLIEVVLEKDKYTLSYQDHLYHFDIILSNNKKKLPVDENILSTMYKKCEALEEFDVKDKWEASDNLMHQFHLRKLKCNILRMRHYNN